MKWMNLVDEKYKKYYNAIIDIFNNKRIPDFTEDIENIPDNFFIKRGGALQDNFVTLQII